MKILDIFFYIYNRTMQKKSNFLFKSILKTPPIDTDPTAETVLYSVLSKENYCAYLLAVKSFLRFYTQISVAVQSDGTLDELCIQKLRSHIHGITIFKKKSSKALILERAIPKLKQAIPNLNECHLFIPLKLLNVICRFENKKVILLDSDILFLRRPDAVIRWIKEPYKRDFYSGGGNSLADTFYKIGFHFKTINISNFNAGFVGIGGRISQEYLAEIFTRIENYDPSLFKNWEIEQAIWAVLLSSRDNPLNLDKLCEVYIGSGWRTFNELKTKAVLAHFVGAIRFKNFRYLRLARMVVAELYTFKSRKKHE